MVCFDDYVLRQVKFALVVLLVYCLLLLVCFCVVCGCFVLLLVGLILGLLIIVLCLLLRFRFGFLHVDLFCCVVVLFGVYLVLFCALLQLWVYVYVCCECLVYYTCLTLFCLGFDFVCFCVLGVWSVWFGVLFCFLLVVWGCCGFACFVGFVFGICFIVDGFGWVGCGSVYWLDCVVSC